MRYDGTKLCRHRKQPLDLRRICGIFEGSITKTEAYVGQRRLRCAVLCPRVFSSHSKMQSHSGRHQILACELLVQFVPALLSEPKRRLKVSRYELRVCAPSPGACC